MKEKLTSTDLTVQQLAISQACSKIKREIGELEEELARKRAIQKALQDRYELLKDTNIFEMVEEPEEVCAYRTIGEHYKNLCACGLREDLSCPFKNQRNCSFYRRKSDEN